MTMNERKRLATVAESWAARGRHEAQRIRDHLPPGTDKAFAAALNAMLAFAPFREAFKALLTDREAELMERWAKIEAEESAGDDDPTNPNIVLTKEHP